MSCGLTTSATVSAWATASTLETTRTPYFSRQLGGSLGALLADQQLVDGATAADQAGEQGLPHHAHAQDGDGHGSSYDLEISDRAKNVRLDGRSASRLIR